MMDRLYLDHNATTPLLPAVKNALMAALDLTGNASSIHGEGRKIRQLVEEAREKVAFFFDVKPSRVVFTSGATEANNLMLKGFSGPVIVSTIEHDSVINARLDVQVCSVTRQGCLDLDRLETLLKTSKVKTLVSLMAANNETGVIQPLQEVRELAHRYGAILHSDAVQAIGRIPLNWKELGLNYLSLSAHKIGGPQGVGALIIDENLPLKPLITGGGQERFFRSGTENTLGIVGLGAAIDGIGNQDWSGIETLRDTLEERLLKRYPEIEIYGRDAPRLPNTSALRMPAVKNALQVMHFDLKGIALSAGSACSSGKVKTSPVLKAMGIAEPDLNESIRVSMGLRTTPQDVERFIGTWEELYLTIQPNLKSA